MAINFEKKHKKIKNKYLSNCLVCGKEVSILSDKCLHCGTPSPTEHHQKKLKIKSNLILTISTILLIILYIVNNIIQNLFKVG